MTDESRSKTWTPITAKKPPSTTLTIGWVICILGALFYCYEYLLRIAPAAMVTQLMQSFDLHAETFTALISLYYLAYTPMQAFVGVAHDLYGPRRVLTFAVLMCALGSLFFGIADSLWAASVGRLLLGFGSAFAFVGALKLASVWLPTNRFAMFVGAITALGMLGGMFGNVFMTVFVEQVGWRQTYYVGVAVGAVLLLLTWFIVRDRPTSKTKTAAALYKVSYKLTAKGLWQIIKNPQMWLAGVVGCLLYLSLSVFAELLGNQFVEKVYGFPIVTAAMVNSMVFVGWLVGAPLMGWISDRIQRRRAPLFVSALLAMVISVLMLSLPSLSQFSACVLLFLFGLFCSGQVICFALGRENAPPELAASAVAFINLVVMLGGVIFQPLMGSFLDMLWSGTLQEGVRIYSGNDFRVAFLILPIGLLVCMLLTFALRETKAEMIGKPLQ